MKTVSLLSVLVLALGLVACSDDDDKDCVDLDGDGYGVGIDCLGTDCDDDDPTAHELLTGYPDADGDDEFSDTSEQLCVGSLPSDYSATAGTDCDDDDPNGWVSVMGYMDADEDGYGDATAVEFCTDGTLPTGYVDNGTDCDDVDDAVYESVSGYQDADHDGVVSADPYTECTDGTLPTGWVATAGTDCDDDDITASVDGSDLGCEFLGTCVDTEMLENPADADFLGIGACAGADCNGADTECDDPTPTAQSTTCDDDTDCDYDTWEYCLDGTCQRPPACCAFSRTGLTCSEISTCLAVCRATYPNPADIMDLASCVQMDCYEAATPKAQYLYSIAQDCAAEAGCFFGDDPDEQMDCVAANCWTGGFQACLADEPAQ